MSTTAPAAATTAPTAPTAPAAPAVDDLGRLARSVVATAAGTMRTRRAARRLVGRDGTALQQTVVALADSERLEDHACRGEAALQVLAGRVVLGVGDRRTLLGPGAWIPVPAARHHVEALGDAAVLVTTAPGPDRQPGFVR